jgi:anti-sigma regulatory factor (Ser/Thr protein kinase)
MPSDQVEIAADEQAPALARAFATQLLEAWNIGRAFELVLLIASELVTNAVKHGQSPITIRISTEGANVRVEVSDCGDATPVPRAPDANGGFGLLLINSVCTRWGVIKTAEGKVVWCDCPDAPARS